MKRKGNILLSKKALSEKALIEKAQSGDKKSLEVLLYDNYKIVYGYLLKLTMNEEITKDITQEVMVKAILNIKKFKGNSKFSTWLISIASNIYKDMLKKDKKVSRVDIEKTLIKNTQSLEDDIINKDTVKRIGEVLLKLPEEKRMVFILKNHFNYSYKEISKILKCPVGTVRSRLHYCIKKIRDFI